MLYRVSRWILEPEEVTHRDELVAERLSEAEVNDVLHQEVEPALCLVTAVDLDRLDPLSREPLESIPLPGEYWLEGQRPEWDQED